MADRVQIINFLQNNYERGNDYEVVVKESKFENAKKHFPDCNDRSLRTMAS